MPPNRSLTRRAVASVLVAALAAAPTAAYARAQAAVAPQAAAAAPAPQDPADALLDEGTRLFTEQADYDGALQRFQESYRQRPSWKALNGSALVYQQQGKYVDAIATYEHLLAEFGATLSAPQLSTVKKRLGELEKRIGVVVLHVVQDDAYVTIDGVEIAHAKGSARVRLLPGTHTLVATLDRHQTLSIRLDARPGIEQPVEVRLVEERVKVVVQQKPVRFELRYPTWVPWTTMGTGVALAAVGAGLHISARQDFRDFDALVADTVAVGGEAKAVPEDLRESGEAKQVAAISLYAVGGAALATGVVLLFLNRPRPVEGDANVARVWFGGTSVGVAVDF